MDDNKSIGADSVFDWGSQHDRRGRSRSFGGDGEPSVGVSTLSSAEGRTNSTRYDPHGMLRVTDITDLVDESTSEADSDDDDDIIIGRKSMRRTMEMTDLEHGKFKKNRKAHHKINGDPYSGLSGSRGEGLNLWCRQAIIIVALILIIAGASLAIGFAVMQTAPKHQTMNNAGASSQVGGGEGLNNNDPSSPIVIVASTSDNQELLEIAEQIISACSEEELALDISPCQKLCHASICCFESEEYSCEDDAAMDCAVYAGCEALIDGIPPPLEGETAEEEEEEEE